MTTHSSTEQKRIAIVGAGVGGAALALGLQNRGIKSVLFERDVTEDCRPQGYSLSLAQLYGVWEELGLRDSILGNKCNTTTYTSYRQDGIILHQTPTPPTYFLSRELLRKRILEQLDPEFVDLRWGTRVISLEDTLEGALMTFEREGGSVASEIFSGVVAADGTRSRLRPLVIQDELNYTGVIIIIGTGFSKHEMFHHRLQMVDGHTRIFCKPHSKAETPEGSDETYWQVTFPLPESEFSKFSGRAEAKEIALKSISHWIPEMIDLVRSTPVETVYSSLLFDRTPPKEPWQTGVVTLIGDAAHPMSPFRGQGCNQAMLDAVLLAQKIGESPQDLKQAFAMYEREMLTEATPKVLESRAATHFFHQPQCVDPAAVEAFWKIK